MVTHTVEMVSEDNMDGWESIKPVLTEYAQILDKDILVQNPHGKTKRVRSRRGTIQILFWSTPVDMEERWFNAIFDFELGSGAQGDGRKPTGMGTPIMDGERVIAEIINHTVMYVLFDLPHRSGPTTQAIMRRIMEEYTMIESPEGEAYRKQMEEAGRKLARDEYVRICTNRVKQEEEYVLDKIGAYDRRIAEYRRELIEFIRQRIDLQMRLNGAARARREDESVYEGEFDAIIANPLVTNVIAKQSAIIIRTVQLTTSVLRDGTRRKLGAYEIRIDLNGGEVFVKNLTRKIGGFAHPHSFEEAEGEDGGESQLCLGNIDETVADLIGTYRFGPLIQMILVFLQNPNEDDFMGARIMDWPKA